MNRWDILALGECMVEFFETPTGSGNYRRSVGSDTLNTVAMASRLGARTAYLTRLGDDGFTAPIKSCLAAHGIDSCLAKAGPGYNGLYFIEVDDRGERRFHYVRSGSAASRLLPQDALDADVGASSFLFTSGITQAISDSAAETVLATVRKAKAAGNRVAFDVNFRPKLTTTLKAAARLKEVLPYVDVLFLSEDDLPVAAEAAHIPRGSPKKLAETLGDHGVSLLVCKSGPSPVQVYDRESEEVLELSPPPVNAIDTSGAGDVFNGAFLQGLLAGLSLAQSAAQAVVAAALQVTERGTLAALPGADAVRSGARELLGRGGLVRKEWLR